jgi:hypothetical protein
MVFIVETADIAMEIRGEFLVQVLKEIGEIMELVHNSNDRNTEHSIQTYILLNCFDLNETLH